MMDDMNLKRNKQNAVLLFKINIYYTERRIGTMELGTIKIRMECKVIVTESEILKTLHKPHFRNKVLIFH